MASPDSRPWMNRGEKSNCVECAKEYVVEHSRHYYCCRTCFKLSYYRELKKRKPSGFPLFRCPGCGLKKELSFNPKKHPSKFLQWQCDCGWAVRGNDRGHASPHCRF